MPSGASFAFPSGRTFLGISRPAARAGWSDEGRSMLERALDEERKSGGCVRGEACGGFGGC